MSEWRVADPTARLTDPEAADPPRETTFADAAARANFVVHAPTTLPDDCAVEAVTYRHEQPPGRPEGVSAEELGQTPWSDGNPCSVRAVVRGDGRALRIKQFLYDWAPPAAGVAPLWRTPDPEPVDCGDAMGWLGTDYEGRRGACLQRERAQIEVSVTDGEFDAGDLSAVVSGFAPADAAASRGVRQAPFHALNYWVRFGCRPPGVPHGLWDHSEPRPYDESHPVSLASLAYDPPVRPLVPVGAGGGSYNRDDGDRDDTHDRFVLDSALAFPEADAVELVFRNRANASDHLWITAAGPDSPLAPDFPPEPADQSAETRERVSLRGTDAYHAALTEEHGAWEALWAEEGVRYAAWAGPSAALDGEAFRDVIDGLGEP
ncbi:hypothetical protein [Halobaculum gomorrense]|uniref:Uncharacterized protein n=1 Tax=Halobaculum gomorrense TaxID=43928 RepID=A0A1M5K224_9EURY|nr:hypothetical protein [Halobaculum gomorrense]SHG46902.1 hypothetical protein SAMN05443636_0352 [Halobaculum gomorrense]